MIMNVSIRFLIRKEKKDREEDENDLFGKYSLSVAYFICSERYYLKVRSWLYK